MATSKIPGLYKDSGWQDIPAGDASGYDKATLATAKYRVINNIAFITLYNTESISAGWKNIGRLPVGARPSEKLYASGSNRNSNGQEIQLQTNGNLFINCSVAYTFVSLIFSYPIN